MGISGDEGDKGGIPAQGTLLSIESPYCGLGLNRPMGGP